MIPLPAVKHAELVIIRLPLRRPFRTSFSVQTAREALLLRLSNGIAEGWGECTAGYDPFYSYETNKTAAMVIQDYLIPRLTHKKPESLEEFMQALAPIRGHSMAKATVENALLDLQARIEERPLYDLIGGTHQRIMSGISIGIQPETDLLIRAVNDAVERNYHRIKIKIEKSNDTELIRAVRTAYPSIRLMVDANADYSEPDYEHLKSFDKYNLMMIEQPLRYDDIYLHSFLQKKLATPICLDESIKSIHDARTAVDLGSCRVINIKQGRVGGLLNARKIAVFCSEHSIPVWSGGMLETGIGRAFNLHLQTLRGFTLPGDTSETIRYFDEDIVDKPVELDDEGYIGLPEGPGTGVRVVESRLKKTLIHREKLIQ
jgi:O-succinylbenzoate synthase